MPRPTLIEFPTSHGLYEAVGEKLADHIRSNPTSVLGLATGRTYLGVYEVLVREARARRVSCKNLRTFNLDEYVGLSKDSPHSFSAYMHRNLFSKLDFTPGRTHLPDPHVKDLDESCAQYERTITEAGGIDLQLLGLGNNGHIGFNEPGSFFDSVTRVVKLTKETRDQNRGDFEGGDVPLRAMTMGLSTIMKSKSCWLIVIGAAKAEIFAQCLKEKDTRYPASILLDHPDVTIFADASACSALKESYDRLVRTH